MDQVNQESANGEDDKAILKLPVEDIVMTHIAPQLKKADLHNMRLTSKAFAYVANRIIEQSSCLHIGCCGQFTSALAMLYCQNLRIIHLSNSRKIKITDAMMIELITNNPHIEEFKVCCLRNITSNGLCPLLNCQNLTHLEFSRMIIPDKHLKDLARSSVSLRHVTFWSVTGFLGNTLALFFSKQPHLRNIVLFDLLTFVRLSLQEIGRVCQQLEDITVLHCKMVDDQGILNVAQNCPRLHTLRLTSPYFCGPYGPYRRRGPHSRIANVSSDTINFLKLRNLRLLNQL